MKKSISIILSVLLIAFTMTACGGDDKSPAKNNNTPSSPEATTSAPEKEMVKNSDGLYEIATAEDLVAFRDIVEEEMRKCYENDPHAFIVSESGAILVDDIDMSSVCGADKGNWRPIGMGVLDGEIYDKTGSFSGTFDGNGHSISGLYTDTTSTGGALFCGIRDANISNLTFKNCTLNCGYGADSDNPMIQYGTGAVTMYMAGSEIKNCVVEDTVTITATYSVGGLVGLADSDNGSNSIIECVNRANVSANDGLVGGIAGQVTKKTRIHNCDNYGTISGTKSKIGGIVGYASGSSSYAGTVLGCVNYGEINNTADSSVCGIAGYNNSTVYFCINIGNINANGGRAFDIADYETGSTKWCINTGEINGASNADYSYSTLERDGFDLPPNAPELKDGSLLESEKLGSFYWVQGENLPEWSGEMP